MISNFICRSKDTVLSNDIFITISPNISTSFNIISIPSIIKKDSPVLFQAIGTNLGEKPMFLWFKNNVILKTGFEDTITINNFQYNDTVYSVVTIDTTCVDFSNKVSNKITLSSPIGSLINTNDLLKITPNPFAEGIHIDFINTENSSIDICNSENRKVYSTEIEKNVKNKYLDISNLNSGVYYLIYQNNNEKITKRIVKINSK